MSDPSLGTARLRTQIDTSGLKSGLQIAERDIDKFAQTSSARLKSIGANIAAGATIAVTAIKASGAALFAAANSAADYADEIDKAALRTRFTRESVQELRFVTDQLGGSFNIVDTAVVSMTQRLAGAEQGSDRQAGAFERLGIALRDTSGALRTTDELFLESVAALQGVANETERAVLAQELFGRSASQLAPLLSAGAGSIEQLRVQARELGLVLDGESIASLVAYKDQVSALQQQFGSASREVALSFLPLLTEGVLPAVQRALDVFRAMPEPVQRGASALTAFAAASTAAVAALRLLGVSTAALFGPAGLIIAGVGAVATLGLAISSNRSDSLTGAIGDANKALAGGGARDSLTGAIDQVVDKIDGPARDSLQRLRADLVTTGDVGTQQFQRIIDAAEALNLYRNQSLQGLQAELAVALAQRDRLSSEGSAALPARDLSSQVGSLTDRVNQVLIAQWGTTLEQLGTTLRFNADALAFQTTSRVALPPDAANIIAAATREARADQPVRDAAVISTLADLDRTIAELQAAILAAGGGFTPAPNVTTPPPAPTPTPTPLSGAGSGSALTDGTPFSTRYTADQLLEIFRGQFARLDRDVAARLAAQQGGIIAQGLPQSTAQVFASSDAITAAIIDIELRKIRLRDQAVADRLTAQQGGGEVLSRGTGLVSIPLPNARVDLPDARNIIALDAGQILARELDIAAAAQEAQTQAVRDSIIAFGALQAATARLTSAQGIAGSDRKFFNTPAPGPIIDTGNAAGERFVPPTVPGQIQGFIDAGAKVRLELAQGADATRLASIQASQNLIVGSLQAAQNLGAAIRSGSPSGIFGAATAGIGGLIGGFGGQLFGLVGGIISGFLPGESARRQEAARAAGANVRGAPAINLNFTFNQSLALASLTDPASRQALASQATDAFARMENVISNVLMPRIERIEKSIA